MENQMEKKMENKMDIYIYMESAAMKEAHALVGNTQIK